MTKLSNEYGISKNQKIEILKKYGYKQNDVTKTILGLEVWYNPDIPMSLSASKHKIEGRDFDCYKTESSWVKFIQDKLNIV